MRDIVIVAESRQRRLKTVKAFYGEAFISERQPDDDDGFTLIVILG